KLKMIFIKNIYRIFSIIFLLIINVNLVIAQENIDSKSILELKDDTNKVNKLIELAIVEIDTQPVKSKEFAVVAFNISDSLEYITGLALSAYYIGQADFKVGNYASAIHYFNQSLYNYQILNQKPEIGNIYKCIGNIYLQQSNYVAALENYLIGLEISQELNDSVGVADAYHNIGNIHTEQFEFEDALKYYNQSVHIDSLINDRKGMAKSLMNIGAVYMDLAEYSKALMNYNKSLSIFNEFNDDANIAICYNNIASVYHEIGNFQQALQNYLKALEIYRNIGSQHGIASTCFSIGSFYNSKQEYRKAINYLNEAIKLGKEIGSLKIESVAALAFSETYYNLGDYKKAYQYHVYYTKLNDLLKNEENVKKITKIQMQYEFDQVQKEEEFKRQQREIEHQAELRHQRLFIAFLGIGMLLTIALAFLIYRNYRIKKRDNILLAEQKDKIENQRDQIQKQKQEITDSIWYAQKIQNAILSPTELVDRLLDDYFIYFKPRDIVSGDFYWINEISNKIIIVAADCTGHGVPGAFMSMLGISFMNEIVNSIKDINAGIILDRLKELVIKSLHQKGKINEAKDGMDISLIVFDKKNMKLQYSGAYNPLYLIRDKELIEYKPDRMPIGIFLKEEEYFTNHEIDVYSGDRIYIFSDGFYDQFGGPEGGKFKTKNFKNLLLEIHQLPMQDQYEKINITYQTWKGELEQIDDILIIGIKL
ncbi:MAG: tetratricopeptide repeat protein, partial [Bacteroidales bacterium]|nr:tetratricopeptide repeat protein [Bacteroidales bacterium]